MWKYSITLVFQGSGKIRLAGKMPTPSPLKKLEDGRGTIFFWFKERLKVPGRVLGATKNSRRHMLQRS